MKKILYISCSPKTSGSFSSAFAKEFVEKLEKKFLDTQIVHRDLSNAPIPHVSSQHTFASEKQESMRTLMEQEALLLSETLIQELETTDVLVIATPMHNYTVPSVLKAWIDHVVRAHRTIKLTPQGKVGLIGDKRTYIVVFLWRPPYTTTSLAARFSDTLSHRNSAHYWHN